MVIKQLSFCEKNFTSDARSQYPSSGTPIPFKVSSEKFCFAIAEFYNDNDGDEELVAKLQDAPNKIERTLHGEFSPPKNIDFEPKLDSHDNISNSPNKDFSLNNWYDQDLDLFPSSSDTTTTYFSELHIILISIFYVFIYCLLYLKCNLNTLIMAKL